MKWLSIVGVGEDGPEAITPAARALIKNADVLIGGERHLALVAPLYNGVETLTWRSPIDDTVADIEEHRGRRVVVLATGDPMSYGIGVTLGRHFCQEEMTVVPATSAFSLTAARMGWPVQDVACLTTHGRPLDLLRLHISPGARLLIMSEDGKTPGKIAALLTELGYGPSQIKVYQHMDGPKEAQMEGTAAQWGKHNIADLNTVAVQCMAGPEARVLSRASGLPDDAFLHDGQITKRVVRAATLAVLIPLPGQYLWDVGAGCGSVAIEWLRAAPNSRAHAIESEAARVDLIASNASALGVPHLEIVSGNAPAALSELKTPDAVFIGGGAAIRGMIEFCWSALAPGGRLVANAITLNSEVALLSAQSKFGGELTRIAVADAKPIGAKHGWRAAGPVTQWSVTKAITTDPTVVNEQDG